MPITLTSTGPSFLREDIDTQLDISRQLFNSLDRLANVVERLPSGERELLLVEMDKLKDLGKRLLENAQRSRNLFQHVT